MPTLVTQPFLPPIEELTAYIEKIWKNKWLTNNGEFHQELERQLAEFLGVPYISLFANGTLALLTALQALDVKGEVITTPYTFVATANALIWNNIKPVFVDIESQYCNLDPDKIEEAITEKTEAIMPVHVYGNPCQHKQIEAIANKYGLKIIYDAAHAFGVKEDGNSILNYGDLSILSFHATKVFNTFEGGAIVSHSAQMKQRIDDLKNFGFRGETQVILPGINGKMNEIQSAMGLVQLKYFESIREKRLFIYRHYCEQLEHIEGISYLSYPDNVEHNGAYLPIFINSNYGLTRDELYDKLRANDIYSRRYFYPLVPDFQAYAGMNVKRDLPVAHSKSDSVLCLPLYPELAIKEVDRIIEIISRPYFF